jgi:hypothetical protein
VESFSFLSPFAGVDLKKLAWFQVFCAVFFASTVFGQENPLPDSTQIPAGIRPDVVLLKNDEGKFVPVPASKFEEYEKFLQSSSTEIFLDPLGGLPLQRIELSVAPEERLARISASIHLELNEPSQRWLSVPIGLGNLQVLPFEDKSSDQLGVIPSGGYVWRLAPDKEKTSRSINFNAISNLGGSSQTQSLRLEIPTVSSVIELLLPKGEWDVNATGAGSEVVEPGDKLSTGLYRIRTLGGPIEISWSRRVPNRDIQAIEANGVVRYSLTSHGKSYRVNTRLNLRGPARLGARTFLIQLPEGSHWNPSPQDPALLPGYKLKQDATKENQLRLDVDESIQRNEIDIAMDFEWDAPDNTSIFEFKTPVIEGIQKQIDSLEVSLPRGKIMLWDPQLGVEFVKRTIASPDTNEVVSHLFRITGRDTKLKCQILSQPSLPNIQAQYRMAHQHDQLLLSGWIDFREDPRDLPFLQLALRGWSVDRITVASTGRDLVVTAQTAESPGWSFIPLSLGDLLEPETNTGNERVGNWKLLLEMRHKLAKTDETDFDLPMLVWLDESKQEKTRWTPLCNLELQSNSALMGLTAKPDSEGVANTGLLESSSVGSPSDVNSEDAPDRYRFSKRLSVRSRNANIPCTLHLQGFQTEVDASSNLRIVDNDESWQVDQDWSLTIRGGVPSRILVLIPKEWLAGKDLNEKKNVDASERTGLEVSLNGIGISKFELTPATGSEEASSEMSQYVQLVVPVSSETVSAATGEAWLLSIRPKDRFSKNRKRALELRQKLARLNENGQEFELRVQGNQCVIQSRRGTSWLQNSPVLGYSISKIQIGEEPWQQTKLTLPIDEKSIDGTLVYDAVDFSSRAVVDKIWLQTVFNANELRHRFVLCFRTDRSSIELKLPANVTTNLEAVLNGLPCDLVRKPDQLDLYRLDLNAANAATRLEDGSTDSTTLAKKYTLELFSWPGSQPAWISKISVPEISVLESNLSNVPMIWQILCSRSEHLIGTSELLSPDYQWQWSELWFSRKDRWTQELLENEFSATHQPALGQDYNQYTLVSLGNRDIRWVQLAPRLIIWAPVALLSLFACFLVTKVKWLRHPLVWLSILAMLIAGSQWSLDFTVLFTQAFVLAAIVSTLALVVRWVLDRNARKRSVFAQRSSIGGSISTQRSDSRIEIPSGNLAKTIPTAITPEEKPLASIAPNSDSTRGEGDELR